MSGAEEAPIYPQYCFHLSPTINKWCPLKAVGIEALTTHPGFAGQDLFFHTNHPIKWVRIAGVVVAIDEYAQRRVYTVDDSSGVCIECVVTLAPKPKTPEEEKSNEKEAGAEAKADTLTLNLKPQPPVPTIPVPDGLDVGSIVDVKGGLKMFRAQKQIKVEKIALLHTTEQEVAFWNKVRQFQVDVLCRPWFLERKEIRKCRNEAEGVDEAKERRVRERRHAERESRISKERQEMPRVTSSRPAGVEKKAKSARIPWSLKGKYDALGL